MSEPPSTTHRLGIPGEGSITQSTHLHILHRLFGVSRLLLVGGYTPCCAVMLHPEGFKDGKG